MILSQIRGEKDGFGGKIMAKRAQFWGNNCVKGALIRLGGRVFEDNKCERKPTRIEWFVSSRFPFFCDKLRLGTVNFLLAERIPHMSVVEYVNARSERYSVAIHQLSSSNCPGV